MSGGGGDSRITTDYVEYVKNAHQQLIWSTEAEVWSSLGASPYADFTDIDIDHAFFGVGFVLESFPSLYDMYGKFMAGLDVDALFNQMFLDTTTGPLITNLVAEHAAELSDDLEQVAIPRYETGMRDINAVMSSTFVIGRALMEGARTKAISKFDADLRYKVIPVVSERWGRHLDWNKNVVDMYANVLKLYVSARIDTKAQYYEFAGKSGLWNFTVLDNYRMAVAALHGANRQTSNVQGEPSQAVKALTGAAGGAATGYQVSGTWYGAVIGAVVGGAAGYLS